MTRSDKGKTHLTGQASEFKKQVVAALRAQRPPRAYVKGRSRQEQRERRRRYKANLDAKERRARHVILQQQNYTCDCGRVCIRSKQWVVYEPAREPVWCQESQSYVLVEKRRALCLACHRATVVAVCVTCGRRVHNENGVWWRTSKTECVCTRCHKRLEQDM